ncbi:hypothetical protein QAD02_013115 [Eretmocerus hayati]|uniref:Uncharacterized protein n=1 Tax=Eretmocerus hayati TaxID=131215 RepID=A0ACC2P2K2_9HYME|nr:hypothetical protein QAD02_013115 [Eretmocerus hayati]
MEKNGRKSPPIKYIKGIPKIVENKKPSQVPAQVTVNQAASTKNNSLIPQQLESGNGMVEMIGAGLTVDHLQVTHNRQRGNKSIQRIQKTEHSQPSIAWLTRYSNNLFAECWQPQKLNTYFHEQNSGDKFRIGCNLYIGNLV